MLKVTKRIRMGIDVLWTDMHGRTRARTNTHTHTNTHAHKTCMHTHTHETFMRTCLSFDLQRAVRLESHRETPDTPRTPAAFLPTAAHPLRLASPTPPAPSSACCASLYHTARWPKPRSRPQQATTRTDCKRPCKDPLGLSKNSKVPRVHKFQRSKRFQRFQEFQGSKGGSDEYESV